MSSGPGYVFRCCALLEVGIINPNGCWRSIYGERLIKTNQQREIAWLDSEAKRNTELAPPLAHGFARQDHVRSLTPLRLLPVTIDTGIRVASINITTTTSTTATTTTTKKATRSASAIMRIISRREELEVSASSDSSLETCLGLGVVP